MTSIDILWILDQKFIWNTAIIQNVVKYAVYLHHYLAHGKIGQPFATVAARDLKSKKLETIWAR